MYIELVKNLDFPSAAIPAVYEDINPQCIGMTDGRSKPIRRAVNAATAMIQKRLCISSLCTRLCSGSLCSIAFDSLTVSRDFHIPKR